MVQEPRRLEHQQHHPPGRRVRGLGSLELAIEVEGSLLVGQRPPKRPLGELLAELANPRLAVTGVVARAGELAQVGRDVVGNFQGGVGGCLVPGFGHRGSTLVANAPVIGRKRGLEDQDLGALAR